MNTQTTPTWQPPAPRRQISRRPLIVIGVLFGAVALLLIIGTIINAAGGSGAPAWHARVTHTAVISRSDLAATVRLTNTGKAAGTPTCTVTAKDPSDTYFGVNAAALARPVKPGQSVFFVENVTITNNGAGRITKVTVSCQG